MYGTAQPAPEAVRAIWPGAVKYSGRNYALRQEPSVVAGVERQMLDRPIPEVILWAADQQRAMRRDAFGTGLPLDVRQDLRRAILELPEGVALLRMETDYPCSTTLVSSAVLRPFA